MAGRGVPPKDPRRRAGHRKDPHAQTVLRFEKAEPPDLPRLPRDAEWPQPTLDWWEMWKAEVSAGPELRLRVAKFGATPEDRARLRMQFAQADEADGKRPAGTSSSERFA